jgi:hypothetical protein
MTENIERVLERGEPMNRYSKKMTTTTIMIINLVFFHHIRLRSPRLRIRKSLQHRPTSGLARISPTRD